MLNKKIILPTIVVLASYLVWVFISDWEAVLLSMSRVGLTGLAVVLSLSLINYFLRFARWHWYLLTLDQRVALKPSFLIYLSGFALTTTPGKAGEAIRSVLLRRESVPYAKSLAALLAERIVDIVAVLLIAIWGLVNFPQYTWVIVLTLALCLAALVAICSTRARGSLFGLLARVPVEKVRRNLRHAEDWLVHSADLLKLRRLTGSCVLGVLAWGAEAVAFAFIVQQIGYDLPLSLSASIYALSMLVGAVSFLPGGLGSAEVAMGVMLYAAGLESPDVVSATVLCRLTTLWFAVGIGIVALMSTGIQKDEHELKDQGVV